LDIHFTFGISYEKAAPLAEKNVAACLSLRGAARRHFSRQVAEHFRRSSDGKMNVQSACALNTLHMYMYISRLIH
jgi:hypothetical protein